MSKKTWTTLLAVLLVASMVMAACTAQPTAAPTQASPGGQPAPTQPSGGEPAPTQPPAAPGGDGVSYEDVDPSGQTVTFWHQHTRGREEALQEIVSEFNATNEWGITVEAEYQGGYGDIFNKMLGVLNTPDAPDLVVAYQNQAATYQLAEALVDMNPMVDSAKWGLSAEDQADFFPGFWAQDVFPTYGNARLGFPPNRSMEMLYYNQDWLTELGFDGPPTTPDEFKEMACAAAEQPFSKATAEGSIGYELSIDASRFASWTFAFGGDVFDYNTSQFTYNSEAAQQAMAFLQDLFDSGCATLVTEDYGDQTDFGAGVTLFTVSSSSGLPFYKQAAEEGAGFEWSVAAIPHTTPEPVMNVYGASVSIPKTTPESELAAWLFVKYYTSPEVQAKWAVASEYFPVRESVANEMTDYFAANPAYKTAFDLLEFGRFEPPVPGYDFIRTVIEEDMAAIVDGADVQESLDAANTEANNILSEQMTSPLPTPVPTEPPAPTEAPAAATDVGTEAHPIKVLFVPSSEAGTITAGGEVMAAALEEATGLKFEVSVPTSYAATIEEMCASPTDSIGFIPALGYVLANQLCGVDVSFKAIRNGFDVYWAQFLVARDSDIQTIEDLEGKSWGYGDEASTSGYAAPLVMLNDAGVTPGEKIATGGHAQSVQAVYNGSVDFATTYFSPPLKPEGEPEWKVGDDPDIPEDLIDSCAVSADGSTLSCGEWEVLDARATLRTEAPDIVEKVKILTITESIPNDTLSFGPDFPAELRAQIEEALVAFSQTEAWSTSIGSRDFYGWTGLSPATDEEYDVVRKMVEATNFTLEGLGQ